MSLLALTVALGACSTTPTTAPTASASASVAPTATAATPSPTASPTPTTAPTAPPVTACAVKALASEIVAGSVSNAAGGLVGFVVTVRNAGAVGCTFHQTDQVKMVDRNGVTMLTGAPAGASALLYLNVGASLKTTIQARNFCGGTPAEPVTVEFVLPAGGGVLKAKPLATNPGSIVPSCFQGGIAGSISMSDWGP